MASPSLRLGAGVASGASETTTRSARLQSCPPDTRAVTCAPLAPTNPPNAVAAPPTPAAGLIIPADRDPSSRPPSRPCEQPMARQQVLNLLYLDSTHPLARPSRCRQTDLSSAR